MLDSRQPSSAKADSGESRDSGGSQPSAPAENAAPTVSLPKGGGAIRGIGEKFAANPVTGTGSLIVPIATSPGRSGFGPRLRCPTIPAPATGRSGSAGACRSRRSPERPTRGCRGIRTRRSGRESRTSYPLRRRGPGAGRWPRTRTGRWIPGRTDRARRLLRHAVPPPHRGAVRAHRALDPRPATARRTGDRSPATTSRRSTARTAECRIADPADPPRVFSWLICESYDDKGNAIDLRVRGRGRRRTSMRRPGERAQPDARAARRTATSSASDTATTPSRLIAAGPGPELTWLFEVVFDYGEGH